MNISEYLQGPISDIHLKRSPGDSLLHVAVRQRLCNEYDIKQLCMGASVNIYNDDHESPLHCAVQNRNCSLDIIVLLLDMGADLHALDRWGRTPMSALHHTALRFWMFSNVSSEELHWEVSVTNLLLDYGANINAVDDHGQSALHDAVTYSKNVVQLLLMRGANVNLLNERHDSPLHLALQSLTCKISVIKLLLLKGANINEQNIKKEYPLHVAVKVGTLRVIKVLLDGGAHVNALNDKKMSPLFCAVQSYSPIAILKVLLDAGALISCGESPLIKALNMYNEFRYRQSANFVKLLIKYALLTGSLSDFHIPPRFYQQWMRYEKKFQLEMYRMHSDHVDHNTTLIQFLFRVRRKLPCDAEKYIRCHINQILQILATNRYLNYNDVIFGLLKRDYLMDKLMRDPSQHSDKNLIMLNYHSLCSIAIYLTDEELLYLVLALSNIQNCFLSIYSVKPKPCHCCHAAIEGTSARTRYYDQNVRCFNIL